MAQFIKFVFAVTVLDKNVFPGIVLPWFLGHCEKDRIIINPGAKRSLLGIIIPLLQEKNAGFGAGMGFKGINVQTDDCDNACFVGDELTNILI